MIRRIIIGILLRGGQKPSSAIHQELVERGEKVALITVKRALSQLEKEGWVLVSGTGRSTVYIISSRGRLLADINAAEYCAEEPDKRYGQKSYNFDLFTASDFELFSADELGVLKRATEFYHGRIENISPALHEKELERFVIELSWKSSKIEGNTYTLLDTENLLLRGVEAPGHSKNEARMILNHKAAFAFAREHQNKFDTLTRGNLETLHRLVVKDLNVANHLRAKPVGITGSRYQPLDNQHQIAEAVEALVRTTAQLVDGYSRALVALLGISYVQPFEDGNKRTSRLMANALLLAHDLAPLSYRSVDEKSYREAMLVFYELNSLVPFKKIFIEQYDFAARNYLVN